MPSTSPRRRSRGLRRIGPGLAIVGVVAVVGSLVVGPTAAQASEASTQAAETAVRTSLTRGTYEQDIVAGRITADQIVELTIAARTSTGATATTPNRAELTRQVSNEIAQLRERGTLDAVDASPTPATNPIAANKSFWKKLKHWGTFRVKSTALTGVGAATVGVAAVIASACAAYGHFLCIAVTAVAAGIVVAVTTVAISCITEHKANTYVSYPDLWNSSCGD